MTIERESAFEIEGPDSDATVKMPRPTVPEVRPEDEDVDPESTLVRDDWESTVIRRVAPHVVAVQSQVAEESDGEARFGWESAGLRRLAHEVQKSGN